MSNDFKPVIEDRFDRAARLIKEARSSKESPAPLDPSKVKAGDTVTLVGTKAKIEGEVEDVQKDTDALVIIQIDNLRFRVTGDDAWTLTDHQPAPEPKPEWKPGTVANIETAADGPLRAMLTEGNTWSAENGETYMAGDVAEADPLVVIDPAAVDVDALAEALRREWSGKDFGVTFSWDAIARTLLAELGIEATS